MEELIKPLFGLLGSKAQLIAGTVVLCLVVVPYFFRLWDTWVDVRSGRRLLEYEKSRLEILKLRYEIEGIRKQNGLAEIPSPQVAAPKVEPEPIAKLTMPGSLPARQWRWLGWLATRHLGVARAVVWVLLVLSGLYLFSFATGAVLMVIAPILSPNDIELPVWQALVFAVFEAAIAFGMLKVVRTLKRQLQLLRLPG